MVRVGVYGIDGGHRHILHATCEQFDHPSVDLTLFTTHENFEGLRDRGFDTSTVDPVFKDSTESNRDFLHRVESVATDSLEFLHINTIGYSISRYLSFVGFNPNCHLSARIYNARSWFNPAFETRDLRSVGYVNLCHLLRYHIRQKLDTVVVEYPPMKTYIESVSSFGDAVLVVPILFDADQYEPEQDTTDVVRIVVPGNVQSHRRDYDFLLNAFESAFEEHGNRLELELLGRPRDDYGERIVTRCQALERKGLRVSYHTEWIDDEDFETGIAGADLICAPFRRSIVGPALNAEEYGRTKGSAVIGHSLRHCKPLIVPDWFQLSWDMSAYTVTYTDELTLVSSLDALATCATNVGTLQSRSTADTADIQARTIDRIRNWFRIS